jgi:flagellar protein FliO/FliZ
VKRLLRLLIASAAATAPLALCAAEAVPTASGSIAQMLFGLGIVLVLIYGALVVLRRLQHGNSTAKASLKVLSAASVGPRERVVMVAAGKNVLVLGVAPGRVNLLHRMDETELPAEDCHKEPSGQDFGARLKQMLERGRRDA